MNQKITLVKMSPVVPPPEIKDIIDKTATFVSKLDQSKITSFIRDEIDNPKFSFLNESDPYHAYYKKMVADLQEPEFVQGVIYPPVDLRLMIDKTAAFVAKNGAEFQERLREKESGNAKFSFLGPMDPYHLYYTYKLQELTEGKTILKPINLEEEKQKVVQAGVKIEAPKEPVQFDFLIDMPSISLMDLDILKLSAQFVARNGKGFLSLLSQREGNNYQFDFLKQQHTLNPFFNALVDQYRKVLIPSKGMLKVLKANSNDKMSVLSRVMERVEYALYEAEIEKQRDEAKKQEDERLAQIDWHDFVIVQTIEFTPNDRFIDLPGAITLDALKSLSIVQKKATGVVVSLEQEVEQEMEEEMEVEEETEMEMEMEMEIEQEIKPQIVTNVPIRTDYVPRAKASAKPVDQMVMCDLCKQMIPSSGIQEHIRIELLDPKWKEQKQAMMQKYSTTNLVTGDEMSRYLKNLAQQTKGGVDVTNTPVPQPKPPVQTRPPINSAPLPSNFGLAPTPPILPLPVGIPLPIVPNTGVPRPVGSSWLPPPPPVPAIFQQQTAPVVRKQPETTTEQPMKKRRTELVSEEIFLTESPPFVNLMVKVPMAPEKSPGLQGQTLHLENIDIKQTVESLKAIIHEKCGLPPPKQKLGIPLMPLLKNQFTLAYYNLGPDVPITLGLKERGGRK